MDMDHFYQKTHPEFYIITCTYRNRQCNYWRRENWRWVCFRIYFVYFFLISFRTLFCKLYWNLIAIFLKFFRGWHFNITRFGYCLNFRPPEIPSNKTNVAVQELQLAVTIAYNKSDLDRGSAGHDGPFFKTIGILLQNSKWYKNWEYHSQTVNNIKRGIIFP